MSVVVAQFSLETEVSLRFFASSNLAMRKGTGV